MKKKSKLPTTIPEVTQRIREFILDSQIPNGHEAAVELGCSVISDELADREDAESDKRLERISYLTPIVYSFAHLLSEASIEYNRHSVGEREAEIPDEIWDYSRKLFEEVATAALLGGTSQLVDMGLLEVPRKRKLKWPKW